MGIALMLLTTTRVLLLQLPKNFEEILSEEFNPVHGICRRDDVGIGLSCSLMPLIKTYSNVVKKSRLSYGLSVSPILFIFTTLI